jgi:hypothetical protein
MGTREKVTMVLTALAAAISVLYLQQRFDAGDVKSSLEIAKTYRAPGGRTLSDVIHARYPGAAIDWKGTEESSCFQHVRVDALVTPANGGPPVDYAFTIDVNGPSIHPGNALGQTAIEGLESPGAAEGDAGG